MAPQVSLQRKGHEEGASEGWLPRAAWWPGSRGRPHLPCELVATLGALELPHSLVPADMDTQLFHRWEGKQEPVGSSSMSQRLPAAPPMRAVAPHVTFEGLPADVAEVGPPLLVAAGDVSQQWPLLREALLAKLAAERPLPGVCPVVLVQTRCR